jgi:hypothetical protein
MADKPYSACFKENFLSNWIKIAQFRKPLIAAVNGYAVQFELKYLDFYFFLAWWRL